MSKFKKVDTKEIGLDIALILAKNFLNTEYLHYGYFTDDLPVSMDTVHIAQQKYAEFLVSHIPDGVKTILDVGAGGGKFAQKLQSLGYEVECVIPSPHLAKNARRVLGEDAAIHVMGYEELNLDKRFDLVLFSESFQYIPLKQVLSQSMRYMKDDGHMLICDFFRKDVEGRSPIGGGHDLGKFYRMIETFPLDLITDQDITKQTAPSIDVVDQFLGNVMHPIWDLIFYVLDHNHPWLAKLVRFKYAKKIKKAEFKYLSGKTNAENFARFKTYHLMLYRKQATPQA